MSHQRRIPLAPVVEIFPHPLHRSIAEPEETENRNSTTQSENEQANWHSSSSSSTERSVQVVVLPHTQHTPQEQVTKRDHARHYPRSPQGPEKEFIPDRYDQESCKTAQDYLYKYFQPKSQMEKIRGYLDVAERMNNIRLGRAICSFCTRYASRCDISPKEVIDILSMLRKMRTAEADSALLKVQQHFHSRDSRSAGFLLCRSCLTLHRSGELPQPSPFTRNHPGHIPVELEDLSWLERMLISRVVPVGNFVRLQGSFSAPSAQQRGLVGNTACLIQESLETYVDKLPRTAVDLKGRVAVILSNKNEAKWQGFYVRKRKMEEAVKWLKDNNPY